MRNHPYNLYRFLAAQQSTYAAALAELRQGRKTSHWMWCIFPQIAGLGCSPTAQHYAIASLDEARAYLEHPPSATACENVCGRWKTCRTAAAWRVCWAR